MSVDNTTGFQFYLNKDSSESSITTSKSREINTSVPGATPVNDMVFFYVFILYTILLRVDAAIANAS